MKKRKLSNPTMGLRCVSCEYAGQMFHAIIAGIENGAFLYSAKCPVCGSLKILHLPGIKEEHLRIGVTSEKHLFSKLEHEGTFERPLFDRSE